MAAGDKRIEVNKTQLSVLAKNIVKYLAIFFKVQASNEDVKTLYNGLCSVTDGQAEEYSSVVDRWIVALLDRNRLTDYPEMEEKFVCKAVITALSVAFDLRLDIDALVSEAATVGVDVDGTPSQRSFAGLKTVMASILKDRVGL